MCKVVADGSFVKVCFCNHRFLRNVATRIFHPLSYIDVIYQRTDNYSQLERARHFCLDYAKQTIDKRRAALKNQSISTKEDHEFRRKIIIDQVLEMDGDEELNDQNLRDQIMTFVAAVTINMMMLATS